MFEFLFLISVSIYFLILIIFSIGAAKKYPKISKENLPGITVVVAARNEEENILECLQSLDALKYPDGKLEIIIVNDSSTDKTGQIIDEFISDKPIFKSILPGKSIGNLKGKANAIANAIDACTGEIILTTDADCTVDPAWAETIASYYSEEVAFVGGYTTQSYSTTFGGMQAIDFVYLLTVAAGAMNLGKPLSCIGNNMSYRKSVYEEVGGYEKIPFSVTEDFQVLMAIHKLKKYKTIYPLDVNALVTSKPCPGIKSLYKQKKRWGVGGLHSDFIGFVVMVVAYLAQLSVLTVPFFFSSVSLYLAAFKILTDYFFVYLVFRKLNLKMRYTHFAAFEIYYIFYVLILPFAVLIKKKVEWKGREYI